MAEILAQSTGRRKESVARVRLRPGNGVHTVNGRNLDQYFGRETLAMLARQPLVHTETLGRYDVDVTVFGGGLSGQAGAIQLGVARALVEIDAALRSTLRRAALLTRDPRMKERKKYGLKRARKAPQYTKR